MTEPAAPDHGIPNDHFIALLGIEIESGSVTTGRAQVRPEMFAPGTTRIRTGILATLVDMVGGHCPNGPVGPTIDMRIQMLSAPPITGTINMIARALRVGRRFIVAETWLHAPTVGEAPFVRATTTFMNNPMGDGNDRRWAPMPPMAEASFDELLAARPLDARSLELEPRMRIANGAQGTVQGGAQVLFAEIAAHHALAADNAMAVTDVDVRYLSRLRVGPLLATVDEMPSLRGSRQARVVLTDAGDEGNIVSHLILGLTAR